MRLLLTILFTFSGLMAHAGGNTSGGGLPNGHILQFDNTSGDLPQKGLVSPGDNNTAVKLPEAVKRMLELQGIDLRQFEKSEPGQNMGGDNIHPEIRRAYEAVYGTGSTQDITAALDAYRTPRDSYSEAPAVAGPWGPEWVTGTGDMASPGRDNSNNISAFYNSAIISTDDASMERLQRLINFASVSAFADVQIQMGETTPNNGVVVDFTPSSYSQPIDWSGIVLGDSNPLVGIQPIAVPKNDFGQYVRNVQLEGTMATIEMGSLTPKGIGNTQVKTIQLHNLPDSMKEAYLRSFLSTEGQWVAVD